MKRHLGLRLLYVLAFALGIWAYRAFVDGRDPFGLTGADAIVCHLLRLWAGGMVCLVAAGCGALVLGADPSDRDSAPQSAQNLLSWLLAGGATISLGNYALGFAGAYEFHLYGLACLAIVFCSAPSLHGVIRSILGNAFRLPARTEASRGFSAMVYYAALALCLAAIAQAILVKILYPDFGGSIYYYFLYFEKALAAHSIVPRYFDVFTFFPTKASGLHYLVALLIGKEALTLASVPYLIAAFLTSYLFLKDIAKNRMYAFLGIIVIAMNTEFIVLTNNFSKTNFSIATIVFAFAYFSYLLVFNKTLRPKMAFALLCLLAAQLGLYTGMIFFYTIGLISFFIILCLIYNKQYALKSIYILLVMISVYGICSAVNYYYLGVCDHSTLAFQLSHNLIKLSDRYINYTNVDFIQMLVKDSLFVPSMLTYLSNIYTDITSSGFLAAQFSPIAWILLLIGLPTWAWNAGKTPRRSFFHWFAFNLVLLAGLMAFRSIIASDYVRKHSSLFFGVFFKSDIYVFSFILFREIFLEAPATSFRTKGKSLYDAAVLLLVCVTAAAGHPYNLQDDFRERLAFLKNGFSAQSVFDRYYPELPICREALSHLQTPEQRLLPLALYTACTGYSHDRSIDPTEPFPLNDYLTMFHGDPAAAAARLHSQGIDYFLFDLNQWPRDYVFAPLFSPDQLRRHFQLVEAHDHIFLLTWKTPGASEIPEPFLQEYTAYLDRCSQRHFDASYRSKFDFLKAKELLPQTK